MVNGWTVYAYPAFLERWRAVRASVEALRQRDPTTFRHSSQARFLQALRRVVLDDICADPGAERFRLGRTLGDRHKHWRRVKFLRRFGLFFRFNSTARIIVLAWLNDESTLREAGGRNDPYHVFGAMLGRGRPPTDWEDLLAASAPLTPAEAGDQS